MYNVSLLRDCCRRLKQTICQLKTETASFNPSARLPRFTGAGSAAGWPDALLTQDHPGDAALYLSCLFLDGRALTVHAFGSR